MHMTLEANYAVRIVELLAQSQGRVDAKSISEKSEVPLRFALKILRKLVADEIIVSYKGAKGGYALGKPAKEITLRAVIESVEGPFMISRCQGETYPCKKTECRLHNVYSEISTYVRDKLDSYTFAGICDDTGNCRKKKKP